MNMIKQKTILQLLCATILMGGLLVGCHSKQPGTTSNTSSSQQQSIFTVAYTQDTQQLSFNGTIEPLANTSVTSPFVGNVTNRHFSYGQMLTAGQPLITIRSSDLEKTYQTALQSYLTAKQRFSEQQSEMQGNQILFKSGLISKNNYMQSLDQMQSAQLSFIMSKLQLEALLSTVNVNLDTIKKLSIAEIPDVAKALSQKVDQLTIKAPVGGIALHGSKDSSGDGNGDPTKVGDQIKQGQTIVVIGNMSGLSINIKVDEISINQVKIGLPVIVSSPAFLGIKLHGKIKSISYQAQPSDSGGLPTFAVSVVVPKITDAERQFIHVGMNAKVSMVITQKEKIKIPIGAVTKIDGQKSVMLWNPKTKTSTKVDITTGEVGEDHVEVLSGLKPGDQLVINH